MDNNFLKFQTKQGTKLLFDNYSGIVIENTDNTEFILNNIDLPKEKLLDEIAIDNKDCFTKEFDYLHSLFFNGYFNKSLAEACNSKKYGSMFDGLSSHLILITTEDCNLRCKYCVYSDCYPDKKTYSTKRMTNTTAFKAIDQFKIMHEEKVMYGYEDEPKINFYGGEPFLNFELIQDVVKYTEKIGFKNIKFLITTNGTVLTDEIIEFIASKNFQVSFSLDGNEFNHDRNRVTISGKGTHATVVDSILRYNDKLKYYQKESLINVTCCFDEYTNMEKVLVFFQELKSRVSTLNIIYNKIYEIDTTYYDVCAKDNCDSVLQNTTYKHSIQNLFEKYYLSEQTENITSSIRTIFSSYYLNKNRKKGIRNFYQGNACTIGDKLCVDSDGYIYLCEKANQQMDIGNVYSGGISWDKVNAIYDEYYKFRETYCSKCSINRLCDVCYVHLIHDGKIKYNKEFCDNRIAVFTKSLEVLYSSIESNPKIFNLYGGEIL